MLYDIAVAFLARDAERSAAQRESIDATLDDIDPPEVVEQTRNEEGMLEYNPDMEIPHWGEFDPTEDLDMPSASEMYGPGTESDFMWQGE